MVLEGYVINNTGRYKHIFKKNVVPGGKVPLNVLYEQYKEKYQGEFDPDFLDWLRENKVPENSGFDIVVEKYVDDKAKEQELISSFPSVIVAQDGSILDIPLLKRIPPEKITAKMISELKVKDNPVDVIRAVCSVSKLRRALTMVKNKAGKETLVRLIKERISELG